MKPIRSMILLPAILIAIIGALIFVEAAPAETSQQQTDVVSGVLEELDLSGMKGKIKTDLGKPVFFEVTKPELFKGLAVGERVTIQVDGQGRAVKVIDMSVPELKKPLQ